MGVANFTFAKLRFQELKLSKVSFLLRFLRLFHAYVQKTSTPRLEHWAQELNAFLSEQYEDEESFDKETPEGTDVRQKLFVIIQALMSSHECAAKMSVFERARQERLFIPACFLLQLIGVSAIFNIKIKSF